MPNLNPPRFNVKVDPVTNAIQNVSLDDKPVNALHFLLQKGIKPGSGIAALMAKHGSGLQPGPQSSPQSVPSALRVNQQPAQQAPQVQKYVPRTDKERKDYEMVPFRDRRMLENIGFNLKECLGSGFFGSAYVGNYNERALTELMTKTQVQIQVGQQFAVKYIKFTSGLLGGADRVLKEIQAMDECRHPNVIGIYWTAQSKKGENKLLLRSYLRRDQPRGVNINRNVGGLNQEHEYPLEDPAAETDKSGMYIFMEYANYGSLKGMLDDIELKTKPGITELQAKMLCLDLIAGLSHCHEMEWNHGDVHARNIVLASQVDPRFDAYNRRFAPRVQNELLPKLTAKWCDFGSTMELDAFSGPYRIEDDRSKLKEFVVGPIISETMFLDQRARRPAQQLYSKLENRRNCPTLKKMSESEPWLEDARKVRNGTY